MTAPAHDRAPARTPAWWMFRGSLASVGYAYLGFPALAVVRGLLLREERYDGAGTPAVSVLEIVLGCDGSTDATANLVRAPGSDRVRLLDLPRRGKGATLNDAVAASAGDILVFTDADLVTSPDALRQFVAPFADPRVGGLVYEPAAVVTPLACAIDAEATRRVQFRRRMRLTALWLRAVWNVRLPRRRGKAWRLLRAPYRFDVPHAAAVVDGFELARDRGAAHTAWTPQRTRGGQE
jgi:glycosyltransferase involved in cell wall biosynthesis